MTPALVDVSHNLATYVLMPNVDSRRTVDQEVYAVIQGVRRKIVLREVYLDV